MQAKATIASYLAAIKIGIKMGQKAIVSSAKPKVVPPKAISVVTTIIRMYSFPFKRVESLEIPASKAPIKLTIATNPPKKSTKIIISAT